MLTANDRQELHELGYVRKRQVISPVELALLQAATARLLDGDTSPKSAFPQDFKRPEPDQPIGRVEYLFEKDPIFLALAAHPMLLQAVDALYGSVFAVTWEDLLIKAPLVGFFVYYHQDSLYQCRRSPVYRFGIYLDRSHAAPIRFLPGSHRLGALAAAQIQAIIDARGGEVREVAAEPGDVIVHDTMIVHGSDIHTDARQRRVIYLEYRTLEQLRRDSPWGSRWIARRRELLPLAASVRPSWSALGGFGLQAHPAWEPGSSASQSITPITPELLHGTSHRIDHDDTENLAWHGLPLPHDAAPTADVR